MCGIAGIVLIDGSAPPDQNLLNGMVGTLRHRGPDEFGYYRDRWAGFVHARLSLIDLTSGQQPMANEDGTMWIAYNGEVFNYVEIRPELEAKGHRFRTHSDTEVILHAFEEWGDDCFSRFNGQWAVAIWESRRRRLTLARDRVGVRPLFVWRHSRGVHFASEVKAIFADPAAPRGISANGLSQTMTYWSAYPPTTVFEGIEQLPPGSIWSLDPHGGWKEKRFWRPLYSGAMEGRRKPLALREAADTLKEILGRATELRMVRADVPVGSYLSGGLDSSLIARLGRDSASGEFRTFSLRFADAEFDETGYQRRMASTLDSVHTELSVTRRDIAEAFPAVIRHTEAPILRTAPVPMYLLSKEVRAAGIKAVLTGEGADEMLAGYDLFREAKIREFWSRQPESVVRPELFSRLYPYLARSPQQAKSLAREFWRRGLDRVGDPGFSHEPRWSTSGALRRFLSNQSREAIAARATAGPLDDLPPEFGSWDLLERAQYLEITTLLSGYLLSSQGDRMLMANSVEGRFPFLDADLISFSSALPPSFKLLGLSEKHILKMVARELLPREIVERKKQAYRSPDAIAFLGSDAPAYVGALLDEHSIRSSGVFDPVAVGQFVAKCKRRYAEEGRDLLFSNTDNMTFVAILSTQILFDEFIRPRGPAPIEPPAEWAVHVDRTEPN